MADHLTPAKLRDHLVAAREAGFDPRRALLRPDGTFELVFVDSGPDGGSPLRAWASAHGVTLGAGE